MALKFGADRITAFENMVAVNKFRAAKESADESELETEITFTNSEIKEITAKYNEERAIIVRAMRLYYGISDLTDNEIDALMATPNSSMNYTAGPIISKRADLGWTTAGHTGEEVNLYTYVPGDLRITGTIENTDIAEICAGVWEIDLSEATKALYNDAEAAFKAKGASVEIDVEIQANGRMTVSKGETTLVLLENKNYVMLNGDIVIIDSIIVNQSGKFYVPQIVLDMIP